MSDRLSYVALPDDEIRIMEEQRNTPALGRVVLFAHCDGEACANGAEEYVAIIGQVFADPGNPRPYCNLLVFPPMAAPRWEGSVQECEPGQDAFRTWRWPPRV